MPCSRKQCFEQAISIEFHLSFPVFKLLIHLVCTTKPSVPFDTHSPTSFLYSSYHMWVWPLGVKLSILSFLKMCGPIWFWLYDRMKRTSCTNCIFYLPASRSLVPFTLETRRFSERILNIFLWGKLDSSLFFSPVSGHVNNGCLKAE